MKNTKPIYLTGLYLCFFFQLSAQIEGLDEGKIARQNIISCAASLDVSSDNPIYKGLEVCVYKRYLYPFYDVVATADEFFISYNLQGQISERLKIHSTVGISKHGKDYIQLFGATNDTTRTVNTYNEDNLLVCKLTYQLGNTDSTLIEYFYSDTLLMSSEHYQTASKAQLAKRNFRRTYRYDKLGRLIEVKESPYGLDGYSLKTITYEGTTNRVLTETKRNDFSWLTRFSNGKRNLEVSQGSTAGYHHVYDYDKMGNLIQTTFYRNPLDLTDNLHGKKYVYKDGLLRSEQSFNQSEEVINLTDRIEYIFDEEDRLLEEKYIYNGKWKRSHHFTYTVVKK